MKPPKFKFKNAEKVEYEIIWRAPHYKLNAHGTCDAPENKNPKIRINPKLKERRLLEVLCEEIIHSHMFDKNEKTVRRLAFNLSKIIIALGWRKIG